jgi:hypothetical protein
MLAALMLSGCQNRTKTGPTPLATVCNPVNISYRFCIDEPSRREAADPSVVWFNGRYFLFASKSGGYWHSKDLGSWEFIETEQIPAEEYAPTVVAIGEELYFLASSNEKSTIYKTSDPLSGQWVVAVEELEIPVWDPMFFFENDKLYLYWGCSNTNPLYGVEVDYRNNFKFLGKPVELLKSNTAQNGWEVPGDYNTMTHQSPWIEGAWVNKINGKYYLQYAGPGTEFKSYSDGVYTSDNPLGPFSLQQHNPFAYRPEGFIAGAGHGSTFSDQYGNLWHIGTLTISQKHMFERRLGIFPVFVSNDGILYTTTRYGDYPYFIPQKKISSYEDISTGWMLLSFRKPVEVSSAIDSLPAVNITDENIRTYWAASGTNSGEYVIIDLQNPSEVKALQVNFAEHNTNIFGRKKGIKYRYVIDCSDDKTTWKVITDRSKNETDNSHDYIQLANAVTCRYVRITALEVADGNFALSDFRIFGLGNGQKPAIVKSFTAQRNSNDRRSVTLNWEKSATATGYNIRYGIASDKRYLDYIVYGDTSITINSLNANNKYFFTIDCFNENGISLGEKTVQID